MSSYTVAVILKDFRDVQCVEGALEQMATPFRKEGVEFRLRNGISLKPTGSNIEVAFDSRNRGVNQFLHRFQKTYDRIFAEKLELLRVGKAKAREAAALNQITERELKEKELALERERSKLEAIKRQEEMALRQKINKKVEAIQKRAENLGYRVQQQVKGKERVLVLVRRR